MARTEAQKAADKRWQEKNKGKYTKFSVSFQKEECEAIEGTIKASGMNKAEFLRWAVNEFKKQQK